MLFLVTCVLTYGCFLVGGRDFVGPIPGIWFCIAGFFLALASLGLFIASIAKIIEDCFPKKENEKSLMSKPFIVIIVVLLLALCLYADYKHYLMHGFPFLPSLPLFIVKWCPLSLKLILLGLWAFDVTKKRKEGEENRSGYSLMISILIIWVLCISRTPAISFFWKLLFPIYMILNIFYLKFKK
jgi:hypothetical protein